MELIVQHFKVMAEAQPTPEELLEFYLDSARYGDTDDVKLALKEGVPVDGVDAAGRTGKRRHWRLKWWRSAAAACAYTICNSGVHLAPINMV